MELTCETKTSTFTQTTLGEPSKRVGCFVDLRNMNGKFLTIPNSRRFLENSNNNGLTFCNVSMWSTCGRKMFPNHKLDSRWRLWRLSAKNHGRQGSTRSIISSPNFLLKGFQEYSEVLFFSLTGGVILHNPL